MKTYCQNMVGPLRSVVVKRPKEAFRSSAAIETEWKALNYLRPPDLPIATHQHREFVSLLEDAGAEVRCLPAAEGAGLDSVYVRDPVLITDAGAVILQTGKSARRREGPAIAETFRNWGIPILGKVDGPGTAEAGDMVWLDARTLLVGRGFRTNAAGIEQLTALLQPLGIRVVSVHLPYWNGAAEVLHLMSFLSPLDTDVALVYRKPLPVTVFELLSERRIRIVDVPGEEYESMGCNVLALSPRNVVMASGNPVTRSRLEAAGCQVAEFDGSEICLPGGGGPTCLTLPLERG